MEALISGHMNFGVTGVRIRNPVEQAIRHTAEVRALSAVQSMPFFLVTNRPEVKSIRDLKETDRIALPAVKVSSQAICLQMAAAKEWGQEQYAKLDPLTVTRPHPDAATAIITKSTELTGHYAAAPYYQYELAAPGINSILNPTIRSADRRPMA